MITVPSRVYKENPCPHGQEISNRFIGPFNLIDASRFVWVSFLPQRKRRNTILSSRYGVFRKTIPDKKHKKIIFAKHFLDFELKSFIIWYRYKESALFRLGCAGFVSGEDPFLISGNLK